MEVTVRENYTYPQNFAFAGSCTLSEYFPSSYLLFYFYCSGALSDVTICQVFYMNIHTYIHTYNIACAIFRLPSAHFVQRRETEVWADELYWTRLWFTGSASQPECPNALWAGWCSQRENGVQEKQSISGAHNVRRPVSKVANRFRTNWATTCCQLYYAEWRSGNIAVL